MPSNTKQKLRLFRLAKPATKRKSVQYTCVGTVVILDWQEHVHNEFNLEADADPWIVANITITDRCAVAVPDLIKRGKELWKIVRVEMQPGDAAYEATARKIHSFELIDFV